MKLVLTYFFFCCFAMTTNSYGQTDALVVTKNDTINQFSRGKKNVNKCTPWHHLQCVYITGNEVVEDGFQGKATRHWWRKSYIGQACTDTYGKTFGDIYEGFFAIPHYLSIGIVNGISYVASIFRASPEKRNAKALRKKKRRDLRQERKKMRAAIQS